MCNNFSLLYIRVCFCFFLNFSFKKKNVYFLPFFSYISMFVFLFRFSSKLFSFFTILLLFISVFVSLYIFLPKNCFTFDYFSLLYNYLDICVCFYYLYINYGVFSFCYFLNLSSREIFVFDMFDFFSDILSTFSVFIITLYVVWTLFISLLPHSHPKKKKK